MLKKIIKFIKYNTFMAVIIAVVFVAVASAVASNDDVKKQIIGEEIVETQGVDNTLLLATDLEDFDLEMKITNVMEDAENYYIDYEFNTLGIQDNVWQEIFNQSQLVVSIEALEGGDLGLYATEELGEVIDYQLAYLKEVQENEEEKGETLVVETTIYTKLIGLVFDTKTKKLPGYKLVVKPPVAEENDAQDDSTQSMEPTDNSAPQPYGTMEPTDSDYPDDSYYYEWLIGNCISNGGYWYDSVCNAEPEIVESDDSSAPQPSGTMEPTGDPEDTPVCDADNLDLCDQELCEGAGLYWYSDVCNIEEETPLTSPNQGENPGDPEDTPVCDADNLDLCDTQDLCEGVNLYWYDNDGDGNEVCNIEEEVVTPAFICDADHPTLCDAQEICEDMGLYWYNEKCHIEEDVVDEDSEGATNVME
jgi:hypothetical protein